jgi:hypothetical protein
MAGLPTVTGTTSGRSGLCRVWTGSELVSPFVDLLSVYPDRFGCSDPQLRSSTVDRQDRDPDILADSDDFADTSRED